MLSSIVWYLVSLIIGLIAFPVAYRFLPMLKDRGYAITRPLGLLLSGYVFWLLTSLHILQNDTGSILVALAILLAFSIGAIKNHWAEFIVWLKQHYGILLVEEILLMVFFGVWAFVRATNPDISGTEKPMEMAFINAILRSPSFPPNDPWLSGYAISYYYFGYVMVAMLVRLSGVVSSVGFNLASALWFGMTAQAAFGVAFSLISNWNEKHQRSVKTSLAWALLAPVFILILANAEGFLEVLHAGGVGWTQNGAVSSQAGAFWKWLDIQELNQPPAHDLNWVPQRPTGIVWWRASRVVSDYNLKGDFNEVIDEFPFFSYLLGDLHPHVLTMPFALLMVALALNLFLEGTRRRFGDVEPFQWIKRVEFWLVAVIMGGLSFLNTWDFPIYVGLFCLVYATARYTQLGWGWARFWDLVKAGVLFGVTGIVLYIPFYLGFSSQAGGILPSMTFFTPGANFWVMFGTLLAPIFMWLVWKWRTEKGSWEKGLRFAVLLVGGLWVASYLLGFVITLLPVIGSGLNSLSSQGTSGLGEKLISLGNTFFDKQGSSRISDLFGVTLVQRILRPGTWVTLLLLATLVWGLLYKIRPAEKNEESKPNSTGDTFVLLLVLTGGLLALAPEFVYLLDLFGNRMNTIFKFFFQTWILWAIAGAYASAVLWQSLRGLWKGLFAAGWTAIFLIGLVYPFFMLPAKADFKNQSNWTLDGFDFIQKYDQSDADIANWLKGAPFGTMVEAVGGSYSSYGTGSTFSGQSTVIQWPGHESQWRGGTVDLGARQTDVETLYRTANWADALNIIQKYNIRYIVLGPKEQAEYRATAGKFNDNLLVAYRTDTLVIYQVPDQALVVQPLKP